MSEKDGGQAFPTTHSSAFHGMTLRDYFAGQALIGILSAKMYRDSDVATVVTKAYQYADSMLTERERVK